MTTTARMLPANPDLSQLKKQAKELLAAHRDGKASVCTLLKNLQTFATLEDQEILKHRLTLHDAQHALALNYGYASWAKLKKAIENKKGSTSKVSLIKRLKSLPSGENIQVLLLDSHRIALAEVTNPLQQELRILSLHESMLGPNSDMLIEATRLVREHVSGNSNTPAPCIVSAPSQQFFVRYLAIENQGQTDTDATSTIEDEIYRGLPFTRDEVFLDYDYERLGERYQVTVMAHRRSATDELSAMLKANGLSPLFMCSSGFAVLNSFLSAPIIEERPVLLLRTFANRKTELACVHRKSVFFRIAPAGSEALNDPEALDKLLSDIRKTIDIYEERNHVKLQQILVDTGTSSEMERFSEKLAGTIGSVKVVSTDIDDISGAKAAWPGKSMPGTLSEVMGAALTPTSKATFNLCIHDVFQGK